MYIKFFCSFFLCSTHVWKSTCIPKVVGTPYLQLYFQNQRRSCNYLSTSPTVAIKCTTSTVEMFSYQDWVFQSLELFTFFFFFYISTYTYLIFKATILGYFLSQEKFIVCTLVYYIKFEKKNQTNLKNWQDFLSYPHETWWRWFMRWLFTSFTWRKVKIRALFIND